ncbi:hypothetical protein EsH8_X_000363 [Colletotrichum jinshuiense]
MDATNAQRASAAAPQPAKRCRYGAVGQKCRLIALGQCIIYLGDPNSSLALKTSLWRIILHAMTEGPRPVTVCDPCCGGATNTLLSYAVGQTRQPEIVKVLLQHTKFRREKGCSIANYVHQIGDVILLLMKRDPCFGNRLGHGGKEIIRLLLSAATRIRSWNGELLGVWVASICEGAAMVVQGQAQVRIPAFLDLVECVIEVFFYETPKKIHDEEVWFRILRALWDHPRVANGTMTRVKEVTLLLLNIRPDFAARPLSGPNSVSLASRVDSLCLLQEDGDVGVDDDVDVRIENEMIRGVDHRGVHFVDAKPAISIARQVNLEQLRTAIMDHEGALHEVGPEEGMDPGLSAVETMLAVMEPKFDETINQDGLDSFSMRMQDAAEVLDDDIGQDEYQSPFDED